MKLVKGNLFKVLIIILLGTLFHSMYTWLNNPKIIAFLFPINESVWEHLKLTWLPFILYSIFEIIVLKKDYKKTIIINSLAIFFSFVFIILIDLFFTSILGLNNFVFHMINYIVSIIMSLIMGEYFYKKYGNNIFTISIIIFFVLTFLVIIFSYVQPDFYLFKSE